jgi:hypothetical protein
MLGPPFTPATARAVAALSQVKRRANAAERAHNATRLAQEQRYIAPEDPYAAYRIPILRQHLARIDSLLMTETDPLARKRLVRAASSLSKQERMLAGRPSPAVARAS